MKRPKRDYEILLITIGSCVGILLLAFLIFFGFNH